MRGCKVLFSAVWLLIFLTNFSWAQTRPGSRGPSTSSNFVRLHGSFGSYGETYSTNGPFSRRPSQTGRLFLRPTLSIGSIDLPFSFILSTEGSAVRQPFNQFGVSPRIGWATFHIGHHHVRYSDLTVNGILQFGGGIDLRPGVFRLSFTAGRIQKGLPADTTGFARGKFERHLFALKLGVGRQTGTHLYLHVVKAKDDPNSVASAGLERPQENLVVSLHNQISMLSGKLRFTSEVAASGHTPNLFNDELDVDVPGFLKELFLPRIGTRLGYAVKGGLKYSGSAFSFRARYLRVNPGFVSFGLPSFQNDRENFEVAPTVRIFKRRVTVGAVVGFRRDNLVGNKLTTTRRFHQQYFLRLVPGSSFSLNVRYGNHAMNNDATNDTTRSDNVSQSWQVSSSVRGKWFGFQNTLTGTFSLQKFDDKNPLFGADNAFQAYNASLSWGMAFSSSVTLTPKVHYIRNERAMADLQTLSYSLGVRNTFFKRALITLLSFTFTENDLGTTRDHQWLGQLRATYRLSRYDRISLNGRLRAYQYGDGRAENFLENTVSLQYNKSF